jgi:ABC-type polar amino acid transport system ATPase subunit
MQYLIHFEIHIYIMKHTIVLEGVKKSFNGQRILDGIDLSVKKNEIISIIGASGAGKSTLLRIMAGLENPTEGTVLVQGKIGMVFQHCYLWPHKTVLENVTEALNVQDAGSSESKAMEMLRKFKLEHKALAFPDSLSGGEAQRVAIARTLVTEPDVVLLDEITSALDPLLVAEILEALRLLAKEKRTLVLVTHQLAFAKEISHRVVFLDKGAIAEQDHPWKMFSNPEKSETRCFLNSMLMR